MSDHDMRLVTDSDGTPIPPIDMALDGDVQVTTTGNAPTVALVVATQEHGKISIPLAIGQGGAGLTPAGQVLVSDIGGGVAVDPNTALGSGKLTMVDPATPANTAILLDGTATGAVNINDGGGSFFVAIARALANRFIHIFDGGLKSVFAINANAAGVRSVQVADTAAGTMWKCDASATRAISTLDGAGVQLSLQTTTAAATANTHYGPGAGSTSAIMDFASTTQAVGLPVMTTIQKAAIAAPAKGFVVFDSTLNKLCVYTGAAWETVTSA